jgi:uncharacterized tellurite resistance protein B-like protein
MSTEDKEYFKLKELEVALGKVLGFAALGVVAVAAAPFTGGGSIAGAATLASSLAGAEAIAVGAAVAGGAIGAAKARKEEEKNEKIAELSKKADKYEKALKEAIKKFKGDKEYFNYILASTAAGISIANADGDISSKEREELEEFIGGMANSNYPQHIKDEITKLYNKPPSLNTAIEYLKKVHPSNFDGIKDMLELVMEADGHCHEEEISFLEAFKRQVQSIDYLEEDDDFEDGFLREVKEKMVA